MYMSRRNIPALATRRYFGVLAKVPGAVFVLTGDDIRRAGSSTIADLTRWAHRQARSRRVSSRVIWQR